MKVPMTAHDDDVTACCDSMSDDLMSASCCCWCSTVNYCCNFEGDSCMNLAICGCCCWSGSSECRSRMKVCLEKKKLKNYFKYFWVIFGGSKWVLGMQIFPEISEIWVQKFPEKSGMEFPIQTLWVIFRGWKTCSILTT